MKRLHLILFSLSFLLPVRSSCNNQFSETTNDIDFTILITSYNNEKYAVKNLDSVVMQESSRNYNIIYINDCSTDSTKEVVDEYVKSKKLKPAITVIHNTERVGALANIYNAIHTLIPDERIVVSVDGDDTLAHNKVLLRLEKEYKNPNVWMTYGTALVFPDGYLKSKALPDWVFEMGVLRKMPFRSQHLRTFKAKLFKKIQKEDLLHDGKFLSMAWDLAIMFPMLEMCAPVAANSPIRSRYIKDVLYHYNRENPLNDFKTNKKLQHRLDKYIRNLPPYKPVENL